MTVAIPILIHLFNLRRYKQIAFPHTHFLKELQLKTKRQSQIQDKWLLACRILFLLFLVMAFAQPYLSGERQTQIQEPLKVFYVDNSPSMGVKRGSSSLLDVAMNTTRRLIEQSPDDARIVLLTNDRVTSLTPTTKAAALRSLAAVNASWQQKDVHQLLATVQSIRQQEGAATTDFFYCSDFDYQGAVTPLRANLMKGVRLFALPIRAKKVQNVYIDTAFLLSPTLEAETSNQIVVVVKSTGAAPAEPVVVQLSINGQVRSAASPQLEASTKTSIDTLAFTPTGTGWQRIVLTLNDSAPFDDTFRITARSTTGFSVLVLNEKSPNPFLQSAFRAYPKSRIEQQLVSNSPDWKLFNLIVLNGLTNISGGLEQQINAALERGQVLCLFPGRAGDLRSLSEPLTRIAGVQVTSIDESPQTVTSLQPGSNLVQNMFERIPENVQLPETYWHYRLSASLSANQQSVLSFRNGDPFFASYSSGTGKLYVCATPVDLTATNFPGTYLFAPFLYQMAAQSIGSSVYASTAGGAQPVSVPINPSNDRNVLHLYAPGVDVVPVQRPGEMGVDVFVGSALSTPGFYAIAAPGIDTVSLALNANRSESAMQLWDLASLKRAWNLPGISWLDVDRAAGGAPVIKSPGELPLWKICIFLTLLWLTVETALLARAQRRQPIAA